MSQTHVLVPDIGDFKNVDVIEVCIKVGDIINIDTPLLVLESDKATIEVPSSAAGHVTHVYIQVGNKVSQSDKIIDITPINAAVTTPLSSSPSSTSQAPNTPAPSIVTHDDAFDVVVIGSGPGGYSAAFRCADLGLKVALVERYSALGGVCLNVGCIPSKALLHSVYVLEAAQHLKSHGIEFAAPRIQLDQLRAHKDGIIKKLSQGIAGMAKARQVTCLTGLATFKDAHTLTLVQDTLDKAQQTIAFKHAIIAAGSQAIELPFMPQDSRIITSTGALKLEDIPKRLLIIGGGIIGMEMATVYSALGSKIDIVEMQGQLMTGADAQAVKVWQKRNQQRFGEIMLNTKTIGAQAHDDGIHVDFETLDGQKSKKIYDKVLVAIGRKPNGHKLDAQHAGIVVAPSGFIDVNAQQQTNVAHIFAIGDIVGQPMLAHKAVHEAHVAAEVIAGKKSAMDAKVIPSVAYTHPEIAWAGHTEESCKQQNIAYTKAIFPWQASGRAIANQTDDGFTKLLFDENSGRIIGGTIVGDHAGDLIGEVCLAIEMGADAIDIGKTIHPHPTLCETVGLAAEVAKKSCTDLPTQK